MRGCSFIFIKLGLEFLTPVGVAFGRTFLGALALLAISLIKKVALPKDRMVWAHLWVVSMLLNVVPGVWHGLGSNPMGAILALLAAVTCYGFSFPYSRKYVLPHKLRPEALATT